MFLNFRANDIGNSEDVRIFEVRIPCSRANVCVSQKLYDHRESL